MTGATGTVGHAIACALVRRGRPVRALVRDPAAARACVPGGVELAPGDVTDAASVGRALVGCTAVYHASGLPEQWLPDEQTFTRVNVDGTRHLVEAALALRVNSFVYTSTIDVFPMEPGVPFDERRLDPAPKATAYERSKQEADRLVTAAVERGLPARFIHPSGVFGPAPRTTGVNAFLVGLVRGEVPMLLPGGMPIVFADDVAEVHVLAEERAPVGARFIASDAYRTLREIAEAVVAARGRGKVPPVLPVWVARIVAAAGETVSGFTRKPPLLPRGQLHFLGLHAVPSARRAQDELGWRTTPFADALRQTLASFGLLDG